mgnify:CR=1 FL=1
MPPASEKIRISFSPSMKAWVSDELLLALRFCLTLGFHVYNVAFMPSLRARFDMGPKDFGKFMGLVVRLFPTFIFRVLFL